MLDHDLGPLARTALEIRRRVLRYPAQVSFDPAIWPCWWGEETALRAVAYLRGAGIHDDAIEAALILVGCAFHNAETDAQITDLGGVVAMAVKVLQGHPSLYADAYWREMSEALPEHQLARAAVQLALLDDAQDWPETDNRRMKVFGDAIHRMLPMVAGMRDERAAPLIRETTLRIFALGVARPID